MTVHHVERILPYTPDEVFRLVGDVKRYPEFVPWITSLIATRPVPMPDGGDRLSAEARVGFAFVQEAFSTRVERDPNGRVITVSLIRGPFRRLENQWRFEEHPTGVKVVFDIDFEFRSALLDGLLRANFERAVDKLIGCFEARAAVLYTPQAPA